MKKMLYGFTFMIISAIIVSMNVSLSASDKNSKAVKSAKEWLKLVDSGKYSESWNQASLLFRQSMTSEMWTKQMGSFLPSLGKVKERKIMAAKYYTSLPGAPEGEYVIIQFRTSFENRNNSIETVTTMNENKKWKVSGYYIR